MSGVVDWVNLQYMRHLGFVSQLVGTDHGKVHALVAEGQGALGSLVLLHGLSGSATSFRSMVELLLPHVSRVVVPEMLGHGRSQLPKLGMNGQRVQRSMMQALDQLLPEPAVLFGNSLGGYMALRYAKHHPTRVRGLFLSSPAGAPMPLDQASAFIDRFRLLDLRDARKLVEMGFAATPKATGLYALGAKLQFSSPGVQQLVDALGAGDMLLPRDLAGLRMPLVLAWGTEERVLLQEHLDFFLEYLPEQAQVIRPAGWGHTPIAEVPQDVAKHLLEFLWSLKSN